MIAAALWLAAPQSALANRMVFQSVTSGSFAPFPADGFNPSAAPLDSANGFYVTRDAVTRDAVTQDTPLLEPVSEPPSILFASGGLVSLAIFRRRRCGRRLARRLKNQPR
jgi:hypothetical protein